MAEQPQDCELLREFTRRADQAAFAAVVRRHLDLVYATALRKVEDSGGAEEVTQDVFAALARNAWQFGPGDSVPAWLYRATLLKTKGWLRGEIRRRRREETAAQLGTTMKNTEDQTALRVLVPLLDEALLSLRQRDRAALLLRYYESGSLREVGAALGVSEDAARKRVASALEHLAHFFRKRGFKAASVATAAAALQHTATATPALVATAVLQAAAQCAPPAAFGLSALLGRLASLKPAQTVGLCLALTAAPVGWRWQALRAVETEAAAVRLQTKTLHAEAERLVAEIDRKEAETSRLERTLDLEALARQETTMRAIERAKERIRGLLIETNYSWPDDLSFVRIPKPALHEIKLPAPFARPGVVPIATRQLLGLNPEERTAVEAALARYFSDVDQRISSAIYETNFPTGDMPSKDLLAATVLVVPPLGAELRASVDQLVADFKAGLGEERWALLEWQSDAQGNNILRRVLGVDAVDRSQQVALWIDQGRNAAFSWSGTGMGGSSGGLPPLPSFLPNKEMQQRGYYYFPGGYESLKNNSPQYPEALIARMAGWLREQAFIYTERRSASPNQ